jgi:hypothetical protein
MPSAAGTALLLHYSLHYYCITACITTGLLLIYCCFTALLHYYCDPEREYAQQGVLARGVDELHYCCITALLILLVYYH